MPNQDFINLIRRNSENIVDRWIAAVRADESIISAEDLSEGGLRDHIPEVIDEICEVLQSDKEPTIFNTRDARVNAYTRYSQNYRAQDLAAELSLLRMTLLDCFTESLLDSKKKFELRDYITANRLINLYIDEEMRYGFSIFSEVINDKEKVSADEFEEISQSE
jgi:RsbT co-antagonist protein rsbRD N-terminal domain